MEGVAGAKTLRWGSLSDLGKEQKSPPLGLDKGGRRAEGRISQMELDHFRSGGHKQDFRILASWEKEGRQEHRKDLVVFQPCENSLIFLRVEVRFLAVYSISGMA